MNALDFISESPRNYIFHKSSNKTNLGGILTLIYLIIFIIIIFVYFVDYFRKETYEFSSYYEYVDDKKKKPEKIKRNLIL